MAINTWVWVRKRIVVNTDPLRRCYDVVHFSSEEVWTDWAQVCPFDKTEDAEASAALYRAINPGREYAVSPVKPSE